MNYVLNSDTIKIVKIGRLSGMERLEKLENETIVELANRMLDKKNETGNEVESEFDGLKITTENCQTVEDIKFQLSKQSVYHYEEIAEEVEKDKALMDAYMSQYKKRSRGPESFATLSGSLFDSTVLSPRAEVNKRTEEELKETLSEEYYNTFKAGEKINWNNADEVFGWLEALTVYINNYNAMLPIDKLYSKEQLEVLQKKYNTQALTDTQIILDVLKENGYSDEKIEIKNDDDLARRWIAAYMSDLEKHGLLLAEKYTDILELPFDYEDEIIDIVYREAQDILEINQDKNIDLTALNEQKIKIAEDESAVSRRREKINFILDVAKILPSVRLIANAASTVKVSTDVKKKDLEAKLENIQNNSMNILNNNNNEPVQPVMNTSSAENEMWEIYQKLLEKTERVVPKNNQATQQPIAQNQNVLTDEYNNVLRKIKTKAEEAKQTLSSLPSSKPNIDTNKILNSSPAGHINTNDEVWAVQSFYKVNSGDATEAEIEKAKEMIEKIPESAYYQPLKDAMNEWEPYYTEKYHPEVIAQRIDDNKKPNIDTQEILNSSPAGHINTNDEVWAIQSFHKVNSGNATEAEIEKAKEMIEKIPDSSYYQPIKDAIAKWEPYYTEKYHPEVIAQRIEDAKKPNINAQEILNSSPAGHINSFDEVWAIQSFHKVNSGNATEAEIEKAKEMVEKIPDSSYYQPIKDAIAKWEPYYTEKYHPEVIAQRMDDAKKPSINVQQILSNSPEGHINTNDEVWAIQSFYKVNSGNATEAEIEKAKEMIEKIPDSSYYQPLKDAMAKWDTYYTEKANPSIENENLRQKIGIYDQILQLSTNIQQSQNRENLNNIVTEATKKNIFKADEIENFHNLLNSLQPQNKNTDPVGKDENENERLKEELEELIKSQANKEEVERKLREIVKPLTDKLKLEIKGTKRRLNQIKNSSPEEIEKLLETYRKRLPDGVDKNVITKEQIEKSLERMLQSKKAEQEDIEKDISNFMQQYEKVKNKDNGKGKDTPTNNNPQKDPENGILTLDDEEVDELTEANSKLRKKAEKLKKEGIFKRILSWIKKHPKAVAIFTAVGILGSAFGIGTLLGGDNKTQDEPQTGIVQETTEEETKTPTETAVDDAMEQAETTVEKDNNELASQVLADEQARISNGTDAVYQDVYSAANEQNKLYASSTDVQNIWQNTNVEAGKMYQVEADGSLSELNGADALIQAGNEGKTIVTTWQNDDGTIGRSVVTPSEFGQSLENAEENAKTM